MRTATLLRRAWLVAVLWIGAVAGLLAAPTAHAQIAFRASTSAATSSGTSLAINVPSGTTTGDVMIAAVTLRPCSSSSGGACTKTMSTPSGWTLVDSIEQTAGGGTGGYGLRLQIFRRVATGSEPASYTWTFGGSPSPAGASGGILSFSGVDTASPIVAEAGQATANGNSHATPAITTGTVTNTMLVSTHAALSSGTWSRPTGMTERVDRASASTPDDLGVSLEINTETRAAAGNTGTRTAVLSNPPSGDTGAAHLLALRPAPTLASFAVEAAGGGSIGAQVAGSPFSIRITARDANGNTLTSFNGTVTITSTGTLSQGSGTTLTFVNGVLASHTVAISNTGTFTITATSGSFTGTSNAFQVAALSSYLIAEFRMDENTWNGTAGEVADTSGNGYHARAVNATTAIASPAIAGSPGTCGYGVFNRNNAYVEMPANFPNLTPSFSIAAWIRPTVNLTGDQRIFADDENGTGGFGLSVGDEGSGHLRLFSRGLNPVSLDTTSFLSLNNWFFIAAVVDTAQSRRTIYAWNAAGTLVGSWTGTYTGTWGTDSGRASIGGETANAGGEAVPQWRFGGNIDELKIYNRALTQSELAAAMTLTRPCAALSVGRFNAFEPATAAGAVSGVIRTKVAAQSFTLDIVSLNTSGTAYAVAALNPVRVELIDATDNSGALDTTTNCRASWTTVSTISTSFSMAASDNGRKALSMQLAEARRHLRVRIVYPATGTATATGCSNDNFAIRPASFSGLQATDATDSTAGTTRVLNNTAATTGTVHRAGRPFSVIAQAVSATSATTTGYSGTPVLSVSACTQPAGCTAGTLLSTLTGATGAVSGTATYSEAGVFTAELVDATFAAVDNADSTAAEREIRSGAVTMGRFIPDRYTLSATTAPTLRPGLCGAGPAVQSFTFVGQPFAFATTPVVLATPVNAAGATLANARPRFGTSHVSSSLGAAGAPVALTGSPVPLAVTSAATSSITFDPSSFSFTRSPTTPVASFVPAFTFTAAVSDTTEPGASAPIVSDPALSVSPVAFSTGAGRFHYGRVVMRPVYGDIRREVYVPLEVQSFNGSGWITLTDAAACLAAAPVTFAYSNASGALAATGTTPNCSSRVTATVTTSNGRASILLPRPGSAGTAAPSSMTLTLNVLSAAAGQTCTGSGLAAAGTVAMPWLAAPDGAGSHSANPSARVSFGRTRGETILLRERF